MLRRQAVGLAPLRVRRCLGARCDAALGDVGGCLGNRLPAAGLAPAGRRRSGRRPFRPAVGVGPVTEAERREPRIPQALLPPLLLAQYLAPPVLAVLVFSGGLLLMVTTALPQGFSRIAELRRILPLPFSEASHLSASLAGLALVVLSRGLWRRVAKARLAATALLLAGAAFALMKGLDWGTAALLGIVALALTLSRHAFRRQGDWRDFRPSPGFLALVVLTVLAVLAIGVTGYRNVTYRTELFWVFAWHGDAPRFLRATLALAVATAALALDALINRPLRSRQDPEPIPPEVPPLVALCPDPAANLALSGDKRFLVAPDGSAFRAYAVQGRSWVCLGGPVGEARAGAELIWRLAEKADRAGGRAVFYSLGPASLTALLDLGHANVKLGETAKVDLTAFTLAGAGRKALRYARSRAARDGLTYRRIPKAEVPAHIVELKTVSDAWLATRRGQEKGFSVGSFNPDYLARFDIATMQRDGAIVAFANLLQGAGGAEASLDLMRHLAGQSPVLMEAFLTEILLDAQARGTLRFDLGGAPLSGLVTHRLAPLWSRVGTAIYRHGDDFYGFAGLRAFKEKFGPVWEPRYVTCPGRLSVARALIDVALLISRPLPAFRLRSRGAAGKTQAHGHGDA
jgi:phosphatidylglycerol lysyltransferase